MKKIFALLLATAMLLVLVACGSSDNGGTDGDNADNSKNPGGNTNSSTVQGDNKPAVDANGTVTINEPLVLVQAHINSKAYSQYLYDQDGNVTNEITYLNGEITNNYVYTYLKQDDGTTLVRKLNTMESITAYEYLYDKNGVCVWEKHYDTSSLDPEVAFSQENLDNTREFEYDSTGRILKLVYTSDKGGTNVIFAYDSNGRLIKNEEQDFNSDHVEIHNSFVYNDKGDIVQKTYISDGFGTNVYDFETKYVYDDETKLLTKKTTKEVDHGGTYYEVLYTYDDNGNFTSMKITNNMGVAPVDYFLNEGHLANKLSDYDLVFMPLSVALAEQATAE